MGTNLMRSARALKGWQLAAPPLQRMPLPIEVLTAIMGVMLIRGFVEEPLRLFLQFMTYLRPGECSNLLVKQLVAPQQSVHQVFNYWAILLNPSEDLVPGKTGVFDGSVIIDSDMWIGPFLARLVRDRDPNAPLWKSDHASLRTLFNNVVEFLGLQELGVTLYTLRHGGATHDILARRRTMLEIKQRGRWSSDVSLKRYVKQARLQTELRKVSPQVKEYGALILKNLPCLLRNPKMTPPAPIGTAR